MSDDISNAARSMGRKGGKARAAALSSDERRDAARKAANARWGNPPDHKSKEAREIEGLKKELADLRAAQAQATP